MAISIPKITAGDDMLGMIELAYRANRCFLMHGPHGVGKSAMFEQAAHRLGIGCVVRDLSLLEPVDLVGLPQAREDGVHFVPPTFLPKRGRGLLVLEELNRAPRHVRAPCLQLLTARRLNDYKLPDGWLPCAAVNDATDGYFVDDLDAALLARFLRVEAVPSRRSWIAWAKSAGVHRTVIEYVQQTAKAFGSADSNPRSWTYVAELVTVWEQTGTTNDQLTALVKGTLDSKLANAFLKYYRGRHKPLAANEIVEAFDLHAAVVRTWKRKKNIALVRQSWEHLRRYLQPKRTYDKVISDPAMADNVQRFVRAVPVEVRGQIRSWAADRGFTELTEAK